MFSGRLMLFVGPQLAAAASVAPAPKPHILFAMADDLGWYNVGWRNPAVKTPHADKLVAEGIDLQRHYAFPFCSPSRSSLMSGRLPYHVNQVNRPNPVPGSGVPRNMTLISQKLQSAGYKTHQVRQPLVSIGSHLALLTSLGSSRLESGTSAWLLGGTFLMVVALTHRSLTSRVQKIIGRSTLVARRSEITYLIRCASNLSPTGAINRLDY
jgi:hypothetical protein